MLILAIETATDYSSVALYEDDTELSAWRECTHQDLLRKLASEVGKVFASAGKEFAELDLVTVGLGPGSFTSLRVGLATAKGVCLAHNLPLVGVPSLAALTWQARASLAGLACPVLDARRGEVYAGFFRLAEETVERIGEEFVADGPALAARLAATGESVTLLGQTDLAPVQEAAKQSPVLPGETMGPDAAGIAYLGARLFAAHGGHDLDSLKPIYVRKSYAEEKFDLDLGLK